MKPPRVRQINNIKVYYEKGAGRWVLPDGSEQTFDTYEQAVMKAGKTEDYLTEAGKKRLQFYEENPLAWVNRKDRRDK